MLRRWCWGIWGLVVVSLNTLGFGKNNLVPTVTCLSTCERSLTVSTMVEENARDEPCGAGHQNNS